MHHPLDYRVDPAGKNPLLESLADQINQDPIFPTNQMTGFRLAHLILHALEMNLIEWSPTNTGRCSDD